MNGLFALLELVILGAHLDDIPATGRAPGANDDGRYRRIYICYTYPWSSL